MLTVKHHLCCLAPFWVFVNKEQQWVHLDIAGPT